MPNIGKHDDFTIKTPEGEKTIAQVEAEQNLDRALIEAGAKDSKKVGAEKTEAVIAEIAKQLEEMEIQK